MSATQYLDTLKQAADLRDNEYTLLMFDLRERLEAEPDSTDKWRALGQVYYGLGLYQSAYHAYEQIADVRERWKKTDHAHLQHMAEHFGDSCPKEKPLPLTAELKASLPQFRYCADPLGAELLSAQEVPVQCACCGQETQVFYDGPFYSEHEDRPVLCPACIAEGTAAARFEGEFVDVYDAPATFDEAQIHTLACRTPSYRGWQQEYWPHHCHDFCEFVAYVGWQDIEDMGLADALDYTDSVPEEREWLQRMSRWGSLRGYLFRCRECRRPVLHCDFD